ncbi:origin recognition complex subunit 3 N-terminus-domain-containing protein [Schizophyllum commune]
MPDVNLDDLNESSFYIPFEGEDEAPSEGLSEENTDQTSEQALSARISEYRRVWDTCLTRIQAIVNSLYRPVIESVVEEIVRADDNVLPGLPYPEIPVVCLTNCTGTASLISQLSTRVEKSGAAVINLSPEACSSITLCMKALVSGFTDHPKLYDRVPKLKRRGNSLAAYDLSLLAAWHREVPDVQLVAVLSDFEDFDPSIVRHMFEICSLYASQLPLIFVLACASPPAPSYMHSTFPRSVLALLRLRSIDFPSGPSIVGKIVDGTFFDTDVDSLIPGPATLDFLADYTSRHVTSVDSVISILQLALFKHFATEPLSVLVAVPSEPAHMKMQEPPANVEANSEEFDEIALNIKTGLRLARAANAELISQGHRGLPWESNILPILSGALRGQLPPDFKHFVRMIKLLEVNQLHDLADDLIRQLPETEESLRDNIHEHVRLTLAAIEGQEGPETCRELAAEFSEFFAATIKRLLSRQLHEVDLSRIWYSNEAPFPSELLNPDVRASVISALVQPHAFTEDPPQTATDDEDDEEPLWMLPDTAIMFARYLDSGRMINVYDWFEAFRAVLDAQREERAQAIADGKVADGAKGKSPRKSKKAKKKAAADDGVDEESWALEVQARFVRALHELDYMGFLKHTGRKADHVVKMSFDVVDD